MKIQLSDHFTYGKLFRFTLPSIVMMVFTSIYGVVDGFFVSNFAGKTAFASINLVMPFIIIIGSLGFMVGTGGTALVSCILGEGDENRANRYFSMLVYLTAIMGIVLSVLGIAIMRPVAIFLGATDAMIDDCVLYGRIVIGFTAPYMLQNEFQSFFVAAEKPNLGLAATLAAGITNMILDAVFVGLLGWGVAGAAVATGISQCIGGFLPLIYFARPNDSQLRITKATFELRPILQACANGSSELMSNVSASVVGIVYNFQLLKYLGENGVSAYGVLMYVQFVFVAIFVGYSIGSAPIVSYHYGAGNHSELKNLLGKSVRVVAILGVVLTTLAILLAHTLASIFVGYDTELLQVTEHAFKLFSFCFLLSGFNIYASSFFTALNNGAISAAISFLRTLLFQTSSVLILPMIFGIDGIWCANVAAEIFAFVISLAFLLSSRKRYHY